MMTARRRHGSSGWRLGLSLVAVFCIAYALIAARLIPTDGTQGKTLLPESMSTASFTSGGGNVPDSAVRAIASQLGQLRGSNPELVVAPAMTGSSYDVSATVDVGEDASVPASAWTATVKHDVPVYFAGVFGSGQPIEQAEVYFTVGGQIVAGAALGKSSYKALVASTAAGGSGWLATLSSLPAVTGQGAGNRWFEIAPGVSG